MKNAILYAAAVGILLLPLGALGTRFGAWDFGVGSFLGNIDYCNLPNWRGRWLSCGY